MNPQGAKHRRILSPLRLPVPPSRRGRHSQVSTAWNHAKRHQQLPPALRRRVKLLRTKNVFPDLSSRSRFEKLLWIRIAKLLGREHWVSNRDRLVEFISRMRHSASNLSRGDDHDQICVRFLRSDEKNRPGMASRASSRERRCSVRTEGDQHSLGVGRAAGCASDGCAFLLRTMQREVCEQAVQPSSSCVVCSG